MYVLAVLSIKSVMQMLNPWLWRTLLLVGMEYIEYAFLTDFLGQSLARDQLAPAGGLLAVHASRIARDNGAAAAAERGAVVSERVRLTRRKS
jgi:hypothetical protein